MVKHLCLGLLLAGLVTGSARAQQTHTVKPGDTLYSLSQRYDLSVDKLRQLNDLTGTTIQVGQTLVVSDTDAPESPASSSDADTATPSEGNYAVRPGDTFYSIAHRYGFSTDTLYTLNDSLTAPLEPGQPLHLPEAVGTTTHRVRPGQTLLGIAAEYGISLSALRQANDLRGDQIDVGQELRIPARTARPQRRDDALPPADTSGPVLGYPATFAGRLTASGAPYEPDRFTVSHPTLPLGSVVLLSNPATHQHTFALINDRGPVDERYLLEVSDAAAQQLGLEDGSEQPIELRVVE